MVIGLLRPSMTDKAHPSFGGNVKGYLGTVSYVYLLIINVRHLTGACLGSSPRGLGQLNVEGLNETAGGTARKAS